MLLIADYARHSVVLGSQADSRRSTIPVPLGSVVILRGRLPRCSWLGSLADRLANGRHTVPDAAVRTNGFGH